ncbi:ribonuclease domain-containing protein [uncultured Corynebacterium sp.]|uniref:ribonuclease domain-containing protein n=1 Tax=uncultured Corynebacterium sp. TaxID=159447 RepID=UPI0025E2C8DD|nr:ribonuclease domain-containing protein [uncultured Corynebacterium sp.]
MPKSKASKKSLPVALGGLALVVVASYFGFDLGGDGNSAVSSTSESTQAAATGDADTCEMSSLPVEAKDTADDILAGGPYDYPDNDNARFGNYEGRLPQQDKSYYREYTVETPGSHNRGARRIITGGGSETDPDVWYYTDDHYESFCSIPDAEE